MSKFTLLSEEELNELTKLGFNRTPKFTDYAILTGCQGFKKDGETSKWLLSSNIQTNDAIVSKDGLILELGDSHIYPAAVDSEGKINFAEENMPFYGVRPVTKLTEDIARNAKIIYENSKTINLEYGEFPQNVTSEDLSTQLNEQIASYEFPSNVKRYLPIITYYNPENPVNYKIDRIKLPYKEYVIDENKFILMITSKDFLSVNSILNDKTKVIKDQNYWLEIKPIKWTYYKDMDLMISDNVLFTGEMSMDKIKDYAYFYEDTDIYKYLDETFSRNIIPSKKEPEKVISLKPHNNVVSMHISR